MQTKKWKKQKKKKNITSAKFVKNLWNVAVQSQPQGRGVEILHAQPLNFTDENEVQLHLHNNSIYSNN